MKKPLPLWAVASIALAFTYLFFFEYLPPFQRVHIPYDLHGYHFPLDDYAFQSLDQGRFPQWDPYIYCGISFVGNINAALFYPPMWLAFAGSAGHPALSFRALEYLDIAHVWLAFVICYAWLRRKRLAALACALGAGSFAYGGYLLEQLQHFGLVAGYAWMPLGLWGIDDAVEQRRWLPLWKVAAASALCLLAGYVPTWFVFAVCMMAYAGWRWRALLGTAAALGFSLLIAMVQLLPAYIATSLKFPELKYGTGIRDPNYLLSYLLPNYFDFGMQSRSAHPDQYLYLGAPVVLGLLWLARRQTRRELAPLAVMLGVVLVFLTNPFGLVWSVIRHSALLAQVCRDWYFLAGVSLAVAGIAALGLDAALRRVRAPAPRWLPFAAAALLAGWVVRQLLAWSRGTLAAGWLSAVDALGALLLCALAVYLLPGLKGRAGVCLAACLLLATGADYKVFGTSKRTNTNEGKADVNYGPVSFYAMDTQVYRELRRHAEYRIAVDITGPYAQELRHYALSTPQGFDPFLTRQYRDLMTSIARFRTDREIDLDPVNENVLHLLGVRYFITSEGGPLYKTLSASPRWRPLLPAESYYRVFELVDARPPFGWDGERGSAALVTRTPEVRAFRVQSDAGGLFTLSEQYVPGWSVLLDGKPAPLKHWGGAFQAVAVPAGEHHVEFRYQTPGLLAGAIVSLVAVLLCAGAAFGSSRSCHETG